MDASLSFGSQTGRTRSGTKGFSGKERKAKKKKQEYHTHRHWHDQASARPDPEEVRARTMLALDRLGHQVISTEPGGYDLQDWTRSLNSLLDDFQEKVGPDFITDEFRARRQEANELLDSKSRSVKLDPEVDRLVVEQGEASRALEEARKQAAVRLSSLKEEREACERELEKERRRLADALEAKQSRGVFSRFLRAGPSTEDAEASVGKLESNLHRIEGEIELSRSTRVAGAEPGGKQGDSAVYQAQQRLLEIRERLSTLQVELQKTMQLAQERELATQTLSGVISAMKLGQASNDSEAR